MVEYDILAERKQRAAKSGGEMIRFYLGEEHFEIPAPGFWPDELKIAAQEAGDDDVEFARVLLGENWDRFLDAGGRSDDVTLLFQRFAKEQGVTGKLRR